MPETRSIIEATQARRVMEDCGAALEDLRDEPKGARWRRVWVMNVALLRAVGHVLDKVDGESCAEMRAAVDAHWKSLNATKPAPPIFWEFIEQERNNVLKGYRIGAGQGVVIRLGGMQANTTGPGQPPDPPGPTTYTYTIIGGPFDGQDQRDIIQRAIEWWEEQINEIEARAGAQRLIDQGKV